MDHIIEPFKVWFKGLMIDWIIEPFKSEEYYHNSIPQICFLKIYWATNPWPKVDGLIYCTLDISSANVAGLPITSLLPDIPRAISWFIETLRIFDDWLKINELVLLTKFVGWLK